MFWKNVNFFILDSETLTRKVFVMVHTQNLWIENKKEITLIVWMSSVVIVMLN